MGKILKPLLVVAAIAVNFIPGVGQALSGAIVSGLGGSFTALSISTIVIGGITALGITSALGIASKALGLGPKPPSTSPSQTDRLRASIDVRAARKIWFGHTAGGTDVHYQEYTGSDQEVINMIMVHASHAVYSVEEIWLDQELAWSVSGGVQSKFSGYFVEHQNLNGTQANAIEIYQSVNWTKANGCYLTGCAYSWLYYRLTGLSSKTDSPFASGITSRITIRGRGALMYDPRLDSTRGGSGSHRAETQSTWAWVSDDVGRNPALQLLWYLLGWKINDKLAVGLGIPPERIDFDSFIASANICDESVSLSVGGTEPRYRSDGVFGEGDAPSLVFENLLAAMNGVLRDAGGKLALDLLVNDLGSPIKAFTEADVIGDFTWIQTPPLNESFNVVRGQYTDASDNSLYQQTDYPDVFLDSLDGIDRPATFDLPLVQSASQAQRLAKQFLQRAQYPGTFAADFLANAWRCQVGDVVSLTFPALGFDTKLFRVIEHTIRFDGVCPMVLREEHADIYAWDAEESPAVVAADPIVYEPNNDPITQALEDVYSNTAWTERYPNPPPYDRPTGGLYIDEFDRVYRFERVEVEFDGDPVLIGGDDVFIGAYTEVTSDYSSVLQGDETIIIQADYTGVVKSDQLPAYVKIQRTRGGADVSDDSSWFIVDRGCTATIDTSGLIEITAVTSTGFIDITSIYNSVTLKKRLQVIKQIDGAPVTSQIPGGGGGGTNVDIATDNTISNASSTSYGAANAGPLIVTAGSGGQVDLTAPLSFYGVAGDTAFGKWQWRVLMGSWADVDTEVAADYVVYDSEIFGYPVTYPGHISVTQSKTGLTSGTDYEFQLLLRCGTGTSLLGFSGTATATAS